jgi:hypothetical protein
VRHAVLCLLVVLGGGVFLSACGGDASLTDTQAQTLEQADPPAAGFHDSSGTTDIPAFGIEAGAADRAAVTRALSAYLRAADGEDRKTACAQLAASTAAELRRLAQKAKAEHPGCEEGLRLSLSAPANDQRLYHGPAEVAALRLGWRCSAYRALEVS